MTDKHMFLFLALCQESAPFAAQIKTILMRREINLLQLRPLCLPTTGRSARAGSVAWPSEKKHFSYSAKVAPRRRYFPCVSRSGWLHEEADKRPAAL